LRRILRLKTLSPAVPIFMFVKFTLRQVLGIQRARNASTLSAARHLTADHIALINRAVGHSAVPAADREGFQAALVGEVAWVVPE
jgi:hypothetical protein